MYNSYTMLVLISFLAICFFIFSFTSNEKMGLKVLSYGVVVVLLSALYIWFLGLPLVDKLMLRGVLGPAKGLPVGYGLCVAGFFIWLKEIIFYRCRRNVKEGRKRSK